MAFQDQHIPRDMKPSLNMGSVGGIYADTKGETEEHGDQTGIKVEYSTMCDCEGVYQKQDMINAGILSNIAGKYSTSDNKPECYNLENIRNIYSEGHIKDEPGTSVSANKTFQQAVIKIQDDDESLGFELKYKEESYMTWEEGTSSSTNIENSLIGDDVAGPSSSYELKQEEVDLGIMKMDNDDDTASEATDWKGSESGEQSTEYSIHPFNHMMAHGEQFETFECIKCQKKFLSKFGLDDHIIIQHSTDAELMKSVTHTIHRCKHCTYITIIIKCLNRHLSMHGEKIDNTFICVECKKDFSSKLCLDGHIVARHSNNSEMMDSVSSAIHHCKQCSYMTVHTNCLTLHMRTHGEKLEKSFDCIKCSEEFPSKYCLDGHIVARHSNNSALMNSVTSKVHRCKHCKYITVFATRLTQHMRTHRKNIETTFACIKCDNKFLSKFGLDDHIVTLHSDDTEIMKSVTNTIHRCKRCTYITIVKTRFNRHMNTHGEKLDQTFDCIECEEEFSSKYGLDNHIVTHHSDNLEMMNSITRKIHHCKHCNYITVYVTRWTQHMRKHGKNVESTFECIKCEKEYSSKYSLDGHIVTRHNDNNEMMKSVTRKIHRCKHCKYITVYATVLTRHMEKHRKNIEMSID